MTIYHLYFESDERACNLSMSDDPSGRIPIKILLTNSFSGAELLKLKPNDIKLVSYHGTDEDKKVYLQRYQAEGNRLDIYLSDERNEKIMFQKAGQFRFVKDKGFLEIHNTGSTVPESFTIIFHYAENILGEILLTCMPIDQIYDMVLDFGSEASQMLITQGGTNEPSELFNNCARHFYNIDPDKIEARTYHQQEDDSNLFRSIFFSRERKGEAQQNGNPILARPGKDDPLLGFITPKDGTTLGECLPNIKISYLAGLTSRGIDPRTLHQSIVMRFIHEAVMEIKDREDYRNRSAQCAIRIYLLVPNVMDQITLSDFISAIQKHTDDKEFRNLLPEPMRNVVFDIRSYSESDASFVYWLNNPEENQEGIKAGNYLIIDVGKGTTDFSVIKVEDSQNAVSVYRSGFVGAGNAITYAMFENYISTMAGINDCESIIRQVLLEGKDAELYRLENILENYKRNPGEINPNPPRIQKGMNIETIINQIEAAGSISDRRGIILSAIHDIIEKIVVNVKETDFTKVLLSGRAFNYPLFEEETKCILNKLYHLESEPGIVTIASPKEGCLRGPLSVVKINKQSDIIGIPVRVDRSNQLAEISKLQQDVSEIIKERRKKQDIAPQRNNESMYKKAIGWICYIWGIIRDKFPRKKYGNVDNQIIHLMAKSNDIFQMMRGDKDTGYCNENTCFYVSDDQYVLPDRHPFDEKNYKLFYDGKNFYVRDTNTSPMLVKAQETPDIDLLYESLFPYPYRILDENYNVPEVTTI